MSELGRLLRQLRGKESLRDISRKAGLSHTYLNIIEKKGVDPRSGNPIKPTPETLRILSQTYGFPYEELMKLSGYLDDTSAEDAGGPLSPLSDEHTLELENVLQRADLVFFKGKGLNEAERQRIMDMLTLLFHESVEDEKKDS